MTDIQIEAPAPTGVTVTVVGPGVEHQVIVISPFGDVDGGFAAVEFGTLDVNDAGDADSTFDPLDDIDGGGA